MTKLKRSRKVFRTLSLSPVMKKLVQQIAGAANRANRRAAT
jgi:hypothetical protein